MLLKLISLLINCGGVTSTDSMCAKCMFFQCYLIILPCPLLSWLHCPDTHRASMGELSYGFPSGAVVHLDQMSFDPLPLIKTSTIESTISGIPNNARDHLCLAYL